MDETSFEQEAKKYLEEVSHDLNDLEQLILTLEDSSLIQQSVGKVKQIVHSLKGTAGSYGFDLLSVICHKMEDRLSSVDFSQMPENDRIDVLLKLKDAMSSVCSGYRYKNETLLAKIKAEFGIFNTNDRIELTKNITPLPGTVVPQVKKCRVLIVEASKMLINKMARTVMEFESEVSFAKDGYEALGRLLKEHFDVIITSLQVPTIDAVGLFGILEQVPNPNKDAKRVVVTSSKERLIGTELNNLTIIEKGASLESELQNVIRGIAHTKVQTSQLTTDQVVKLLVIDDSPDVHKLVDLSFKSHPTVAVTHCTNPLDAEKVAVGLKPHLILLDVQMPQMSGEALFINLKANPQLASTLIAFLTASDTPEELRRLTALGAAKIIKKPFSLKGLANEVLSDFVKKAA